MRPELYDTAALAAARGTYFGRMRTKLIHDATELGFQVIDMEPVFRKAYALDHLAFEFRNDGHWNSYGHAVVAAAVRETLSGWEPLAPFHDQPDP
jgi:hypothetical protein